MEPIKNKIRLDTYIAKKYNFSRKIAQEKVILGLVKVNQKINKKASYIVKENDEILLIEVQDNFKQSFKENEEDLKVWQYQLEVIYEDEYFLVVNKPSGIIVHPTVYENNYTLANIVKNYFTKNGIKYDGDENRYGIVHRLDKDTSGLVIVAKKHYVYELFTKIFYEQKIQKKYFALVWNYLQTKIVEVNAPIKRIELTNKHEVSQDIDAKNAITIFKEIKKYKNFSLIQAEIKTGKTHQIRVHAHFINNPIINDPIYGKNHKTSNYGQYLTAYYLKFIHPITKKNIKIEIDIPSEFKNYIQQNKN